MSEPWDDDAYEAEVMGGNAERLARAIVGDSIVSAERVTHHQRYWEKPALKITLGSGREVYLVDTDDCCAYTELDNWVLNLPDTEHVITSVTTEDNYQKWHIYAASVPVLDLDVAWSPGNPYYYGFGFLIKVKED